VSAAEIPISFRTPLNVLDGARNICISSRPRNVRAQLDDVRAAHIARWPSAPAGSSRGCQCVRGPPAVHRPELVEQGFERVHGHVHAVAHARATGGVRSSTTARESALSGLVKNFARARGRAGRSAAAAFRRRRSPDSRAVRSRKKPNVRARPRRAASGRNLVMSRSVRRSQRSTGRARVTEASPTQCERIDHHLLERGCDPVRDQTLGEQWRRRDAPATLA
jgi:hypothetical protein